MTNLTSLSSGTIAAAAGTIAGISMELDPISNTLFALGFTGGMLGTFYAHPDFMPNQQNPYATVLGAICQNGLGLFLKYGVNAPNYLTTPVLLCTALFTTWAAAYAEDQARAGQDCTTRAPGWLKSIFSVNIVRNTNNNFKYFVVSDCTQDIKDMQEDMEMTDRTNQVQKDQADDADQGELDNLPANARPAVISYQAIVPSNTAPVRTYQAYNKL